VPRYRLILEYDGGPFRGFQAQAGVPSVQEAIERAIHGFCGERVRIHAAGRTDTGVHATGQVAHADLERAWPPQVVRDALNAHLVPQPISILACEVAEPGWHSRFSATERRYLYRILDRRSPAALDRARVWWVKTALDAQAMAAAAAALIGTHDFTTFRDMACQSKSAVKTLDRLEVARVGAEVQLAFAARSFLHRQVRSMVGTLTEVGAGRWTAVDVLAALRAADRRACGPVAPAHGLYLTGVSYAAPSAPAISATS
jgi:tRNA pseudouridine38-40 synthase